MQYKKLMFDGIEDFELLFECYTCTYVNLIACNPCFVMGCSPSSLVLFLALCQAIGLISCTRFKCYLNNWAWIHALLQVEKD